MNQDQHIILSFMVDCHVRVGDGVSIDEIMDYGVSKGLGLDELERALIEASAKGWILAFDHHVNLTHLGHQLINPANDNSYNRS